MNTESLYNRNYNGRRIFLTDDKGITREFNRGEYISKISEEFKQDKYNKKNHNQKNHYEKVQMLLDEMPQNLRDSIGGSAKTFNRNFDYMVKTGEKPKSTGAEMRCINIIRALESFFNMEGSLLSGPTNITIKKNEYIHSLVFPLIDMMITTGFYCYVPYSTEVPGYRCYLNQLKMIEDNIQILYAAEESDETYKLWQEIIEPLRNIIGGDYPGIEESSIWFRANPNLAYFDCVYRIADKNYQMYDDIINGQRVTKEGGKLHFNLNLGDNKTEVKKNIAERDDFFISNNMFKAEEKDVLFLEEFRKAYLDIAKTYLRIYFPEKE